MSVRSIKSAATQGIRFGGLPKSKNDDEDPTEKKYRTCNDLDDILAIVGSQGKYQKIFLYAILSPLTAMEPLLGLNLLFMLYEPNHWCHVPGREESGMDLESWKNLTIPRDAEGEFSKCEMFVNGYNQSKTIECTNGWEYDLKDYDHTIPMDFNWVCDRGQWATWCLTANAVGNAIGTVVLGQAADKIGRRPVFFTTLLLNILGRIASLYLVDTLWMFLLLAVITGLGFPMIYIAPAMIGAEFSDKEFRAWIYSWTWMIWVVGMASLPWIAYLARDWYLIGLVTTIPCALAFLCCKWVPESPRWLISCGQVEKAAEVLKVIAKTNGTQDRLSDQELNSMLKQLVIKQDQCDQSHSVFQLFNKWRLARNTLLVTVSWIMNGVIYYCITLNSSNLSGNQFLNFFILALIEVPAGYLGSVFCDKLGRRWTQVAIFVLCLAASLLAGVAVQHPTLEGWRIFSIIAAVVAKFSITLTFLVVYLQATEIFPTPLRSTGSGFASTIASVVGIFTPYIVYLAKYNLGAPWFTIAAMSFVGVLSSACLPETLNQTLPETLEEAANFGKGNKFWSFRPPENNAEKKEVNSNGTF